MTTTSVETLSSFESIRRAPVRRHADGADEIAAIVQRGRNAFDDDVTLRRALERCLELSFWRGSEVSLARASSAHPTIPWSDIARVRDRLSHHYHRIDPAQLWVVAEVDVPAVAHHVRSLQA